MTKVRALLETDLPVIADIYAHYVTTTVATFDETPLTTDGWRAKAGGITDAGLPFLVAEVDGQVAGYAYVAQYRPKPAYRHTLEDTIYLAPGFTGRGLGRLLLGSLIDAARRTPARQLVAVIADSGDPSSARLHERFGFETAGRLRSVGFKHDRWIDTVLMQLDLR
ncbi:Phosphinothricin N-acetyltransferase [[Actinomadura] parvosata subsp. kistnae]|uniref:GNAT family N-acetyltransferase n=1 Tax=[Actinomadura] parvosata subsp. kistnae TaxID=1909395 RepID=A0A1U9ZS60_9ACTN|nr:GNAT family N-acetyltransferase [Nonomuraea sp. ATCC 55076]AQZ60773.1 GNAT family N-acetyltransferase [Nonomuraea sp. ATCC 55076]SPL90600.1 Phosphinothricin N-acetyltransferase [Actinomadura parvosata subsp. kistnae]